MYKLVQAGGTSKTTTVALNSVWLVVYAIVGSRRGSSRQDVRSTRPRSYEPNRFPAVPTKDAFLTHPATPQELDEVEVACFEDYFDNPEGEFRAKNQEVLLDGG